MSARAVLLSGSYMLYARHRAAPGPEVFETLKLDVPNVSSRMDNLRAAILRTAKSGTISAMGILRELPTSFVVELGGLPTQRCSSLPCVNPVQCTSTMSWLVFLPACLQAASSNPAPAATAP